MEILYKQCEISRDKSDIWNRMIQEKLSESKG